MVEMLAQDTLAQSWLLMNGETVYDFHWDSAKALANAREHGVTFDQAATVLLDPLALTVYDEAHSGHEERWFTLGFDATGRLLAIARTYEVVSPSLCEFASSRHVRRP